MKKLLAAFFIPVFLYCQTSNAVPSGELIEGFGNINGWILGGGECFYCLDKVNFTQGLSSIMIGTHCPGKISAITEKIYLDFRNYESFSIDLYFPDVPKNIVNFRVELSSTKLERSYLRANITAGTRVYKGWNRLVFSKSDFSLVYGAENWLNIMRELRISQWVENDTSTVTIDNFRGYPHKAQPIAIITFDDGVISQKTIAKPILDSLGFKATIFINGCNANSKSKEYLHWPDLDNLYTEGWDIGNHTYSHTSLVELSDSLLDWEINGARDTLIKHGYDRSSDYFSIPFGQFNSKVLSKIREKNKLARNSNDWRYQSHPTGLGYDYFMLREHNETQGIMEQIRDIDEAIQRGQLLVYLFHDISTYAQKFSSIMHNLKLRQDNGLLKVMTISQYWNFLNTDTSEISEKQDGIFRYDLLQNYPNPFNPTTKIDYELENDSFISIRIFNILGQEVRTLYNGIQSKGKHRVLFDASGLASGIYIYRMEYGNNVITRKMLLLQ